MTPLPPSSPKQPVSVPPPGKPPAYVAASLQLTSGPLPSPDLLRGYDLVVPGGAERIVRMAEEEGFHRRRLEEKALDAEIESMRRSFWEARFGQFFAFAIAALFLAGGVYVAVRGQPIAGEIFGSVGIAGIVTAFITGRKKPEPEQKPVPSRSGVKSAKKRK